MFWSREFNSSYTTKVFPVNEQQTSFNKNAFQ